MKRESKRNRNRKRKRKEKSVSNYSRGKEIHINHISLIVIARLFVDQSRRNQEIEELHSLTNLKALHELN